MAALVRGLYGVGRGDHLYAPWESFREGEIIVFIGCDGVLHRARVDAVHRPRAHIPVRFFSSSCDGGGDVDYPCEREWWGKENLPSAPEACHAMAALQERLSRLTGSGPDRPRQRRGGGDKAEGDANRVHKPAAPSEPTPPRTARVVLTAEDIESGRFRVTPGMRQMLQFYGLVDRLTLEGYGHYRLSACVRGEYIEGTDVAGWYRENALASGDSILVISPSKPGNDLRLAVADARPGQAAVGWSRGRQLGLRHWAYSILRERPGAACHYRALAERIARQAGFHVKPESLGAVLSANDHLFRSLGSGLWALTEGSGPQFSVDAQNLLFAIAEDDLVHKVLAEEGRPLTAREIWTRLAQYFLLRQVEIAELDPIDPADPRLVRMPDGRWGLAEWEDLAAGGREPVCSAVTSPEGNNTCQPAPEPSGASPQSGLKQAGSLGEGVSIAQGLDSRVSGAGAGGGGALAAANWGLEARARESQAEIARLSGAVAHLQDEAARWRRCWLMGLAFGLVFPPLWFLAGLWWWRYRTFCASAARQVDRLCAARSEYAETVKRLGNCSILGVRECLGKARQPLSGVSSVG